MLQSFIKAGKLRHWLARVNCPPVIKECKALFDKFYAPVQHDTEIDDGGDGVFVETSFADNLPVPCTTPDDLFNLVQQQKTVMPAQLQHYGVIYATSSAHLSNSLIHFYMNGNRSKPPIPGCIKYIYKDEGKMLFAVQHQLPACNGIIDPFEPYIHFPAKLYSSSLNNVLEVVLVNWVMCHFAQWQMLPDHVVVLSLSQVHSMVLFFKPFPPTK
jgi:hypothetical protein